MNDFNEIGEDNFFLFGLTTDEVYALKSKGYNPRSYVDLDEKLRAVMESLSDGTFSNGDGELFKPLVDSLLDHDPYLLMADYRAYIDCQDRVDNAYRDQKLWTRMSILNVARIGTFSSDRSIRDYAENIWGVKPVKISLD